MEDSDQRRLGLLLADAGRLLRRRFEQESRDLPMSSAQMHIIVRLSRNEGISQAALAAMLELKPMTLCRHVDRMVAQKLVERRQDPDDRRARQLFTTTKSRRLLAPMRERADVIYEQAQIGLSPAARVLLLDGLETVISNLRQAENEPLAPVTASTKSNVREPK